MACIGNRVLIMNNGVRQEGQNWGNDHAPEIDPFIATKVTVIKGSRRYPGTARMPSEARSCSDPKDLPNQPGIDGEVNLVGLTNGRSGVASGYLEGASGGEMGRSELESAGNGEESRQFEDGRLLPEQHGLG